MKKTKRPLNFAAPSLTKDALKPPEEEAFGLGMPPVPKAVGKQPTVASEQRRVTNSVSAPPPAPQGRTQREPGGGFIYFLAVAATLLWVGGLTAYTLGLRSHAGPFEDERFAVLVLGLLCAAPVGLIWIGAFAFHQGMRLLGETRRLQVLSDKMLGPAALAAARAGSAVNAIRNEIDSAAETAEHARLQLLSLRDTLSQESDRLIELAAGAARDASGLLHNLGRERQEFGLLSGQLQSRVGEIGDAITRHARMVTEASDLAQTQIQEAEAALAARAADLAAAAGEATEAARMAGDDLARQAARVEQAGVTVSEQVHLVEEGLGQQRAALVTLSHALRSDQEDLAVHFESQRAQLVEILRQSEHGAEQVGAVALRGADTLRDLIDLAVDQLRDMSDRAQTERDLLGGASLQSLGAFSEAAAFERRALEEQTRRAIDELTRSAEEAHRAAETAAAAARLKVEQLSQAALAVGDTAEASFDTRLNQARGLIEASVQLVDEAGVRSAEKLEKGVSAAFSAMDALQKSLSDIEARAARVPEDISAQGEDIRAALELANKTLLTGARAAAQELEAIDTAFQERVKRNYDMLSEAVRLMGVLGGGAATRASGPPSIPPRPPQTPGPSLPLRDRGTSAPAADPGRDIASEDLNLRPRLKLTGLEDKAAAKPPTPGEGDPDWTWNELVAALDETDADDSEIERTLIAEIEALGIDAAALIPQRRLPEVAEAYEASNSVSAREIVHRVAPAAVRKLARRVMSDKLVRAQAERFVDRYAALIRGAARRGTDGVTASSLLASNAGRAFLLLDAAVGDLD